MSKKEKIINLALRLLRQEPTEENKEIVKDFYVSAVKKVLKDQNFDFCKKYTQLVLTGNIPQNPKYLYEYEYPSDCVKVRKIFQDPDKNEPFEIALNKSDQKVIYTNETPIIAQYTTDSNYEENCDGSFISLCAYCLAALAAYSVTRNLMFTNECTEMYEQLLFTVEEKLC